MKKNGHDIFIKNEQNIFKVTGDLKKLVIDSVCASLDYEGFEGSAEVSITFTDNVKIKELNAEYRNKDKVTDVLSFPIYDEDDIGGKVVLGDIVISLERAKEQAEEYGHSFEREVAFLCVHSMLHLLGYDHEESKAQESEMFAIQKKILCNMGIAR